MTFGMRSFSLVILLAVICINLGCGGNGIYPVAGVVLLDGSPLPGATVTFQPEGSGQPAFATTGADGAFALATPAGKGATAGEYKVSVSKIGNKFEEPPPPWAGRRTPVTPSEIAAWSKKLADDRSKEVHMVPEPYRTSATTPLRVKVPLDSELVIDLNSTPEPAKK